MAALTISETGEEEESERTGRGGTETGDAETRRREKRRHGDTETPETRVFVLSSTLIWPYRHISVSPCLRVSESPVSVAPSPLSPRPRLRVPRLRISRSVSGGHLAEAQNDPAELLMPRLRERSGSGSLSPARLSPNVKISVSRPPAISSRFVCRYREAAIDHARQRN